MGTIMNFISQHIHITDSLVHPHQQQKQQQPSDKPRYYSIFSDLSAMGDQRERALQQFPCEEKHSFNPHYQHNLISTSPSSPPSLSSSPSNSSPSSAYSSSSSYHSSLSRATGARSSGQDSHLHHYNTVSGSGNIGSSSCNGSKHDYSYHRHYNRRQNLRRYTTQQQQEHFHDDWMFGITEDDDYRGANAKSPSPSTMTRASPQEPLISSSSSTVSLKSSLSRRSRSQHGDIMNAFPNSVATNTTPRSTAVTFSPVVLQQSTASSLGLLSSISESSHSSLDFNNGTTAVVATAISTSSAAATTSTSTNPASCATSSTSLSQQQSGAGRLTAKQSLMRITQCSKSEEGWCSQKAGQYTQRYADDSNSRGLKTDGRRTRRL
ncbi:hypothetical protein EDD21DRAFT_212640 [Dissophora ornata]|nr:hypothetical protein BGZ58_008430 [Dissophora ornata]KAI8597594.1 hypothetical protein EDD21DRAFT_212640 [Dissophora ornata]